VEDPVRVLFALDGGGLAVQQAHHVRAELIGVHAIHPSQRPPAFAGRTRGQVGPFGGHGCPEDGAGRLWQVLGWLMPIVCNIYHAFTIVASVASQEAHPPSGTKPPSTGHEHATGTPPRPL